MAARTKKVEDDKKLAEVEPENKMITDLLEKIVNQNEQVIQLLTQLKERFI